MKNWGISALIAAIIIIGLVLRYGKSSHYLASDFFKGTTGWFKVLSLQGVKGGNTPSGGSLI